MVGVLIIAPLIGEKRDQVYEIFGLLRENGYLAYTIENPYNTVLTVIHIQRMADQGLLQKVILIDEGTKDPYITKCISRIKNDVEIYEQDGPSISVEVVDITQDGKSLAAKLIKVIIDSMKTQT